MGISINSNLSQHVQVIQAIGKPWSFLLIPYYATICCSLSRPQTALKVYPFPCKRSNAKLKNTDLLNPCFTAPFARKGFGHTNQWFHQFYLQMLGFFLYMRKAGELRKSYSTWTFCCCDFPLSVISPLSSFSLAAHPFLFSYIGLFLFLPVFSSLISTSFFSLCCVIIAMQEELLAHYPIISSQSDLTRTCAGCILTFPSAPPGPSMERDLQLEPSHPLFVGCHCSSTSMTARFLSFASVLITLPGFPTSVRFFLSPPYFSFFTLGCKPNASSLIVKQKSNSKGLYRIKPHLSQTVWRWQQKRIQTQKGLNSQILWVSK